MNTMTEWLSQYFDEIGPRDFYREIFPEGSFEKRGVYVRGGYNGILVSVAKEKRADGSPKVKKYIVTDELDAIEEVCRTDDFCLMSPISYAGKNRTAENARFLYAFAVDLDRLRMDGQDPVGLRALWNRHIEAMDRIPKPTFIVSSGTGLHLYYVLEDPVAMFKDTSRRLQDLKRDLTSLIWHDTIVDIESVKDIQQEGIYQGFRVPGTITKKGDRARAFLTGGRISIEALLDYTEGLRKSRERLEAGQFVKKKTLTRAKAKELYPDWYERRIERQEEKGTWHVSRNVYDWWKGEIQAGAAVGHRYYCVMMLAIYARKCSMYDPKHNPNPVTEEELREDAFGLLEHMEAMTEDENNHFTTADILDALEAFNEKWITYPRNSVEYKSGIRIKVNKRNGRKQADHIKLMNYVRDEINQNKYWRVGNGRPDKRAEVETWHREHPEGTKADCIRALGVDRKTVSKYWAG
ncbi:MAG: hypothetical protein IJ153_10575 [Clostridia bacterium]|nr:hypothetical protein [Clostridia bacterium]